MLLVTELGEVKAIGNFTINGITNCPDFTIRYGQTLGEAVRPLTQHSCEFCRMIHSAKEGEAPDNEPIHPQLLTSLQS